jgi:hypothetical protein
MTIYIPKTISATLLTQETTKYVKKLNFIKIRNKRFTSDSKLQIAVYTQALDDIRVYTMTLDINFTSHKE